MTAFDSVFRRQGSVRRRLPDLEVREHVRLTDMATLYRRTRFWPKRLLETSRLAGACDHWVPRRKLLWQLKANCGS